MREFDRTERIGAELQRVLSMLIHDEVKDPRLVDITIQEVRVSRDLAHAKVFFTCFPTDEGAAEQERLLNGRLAGFLRHALAQRVRLRAIPQLHFVFDASIGQGARLAALITEVVGGSRGEPHHDGDPETPVDGPSS